MTGEPGHQPVPGEPGRQIERTRLAWRRTLLALSVAVLLLNRLALTGGTFGAVLAAAATVGWAVALALLWRRAHGVGPARSGGRLLPLAALATAGYALIGVLLVLDGLGRS